MKIEYSLHENDFLAFQLFSASKSERIRQKKRNGWMLLTGASILLAFYFYLNQNIVMTVYFGLVAIVCALFYPKYFKWRYKRHYKSYIKENYATRFGQIATMEISNDSIASKDKTGEGKIIISEIEKVDETTNHFFLKISSGLSLIIPKREIGNTGDLRQKFKELKLPVNDETNWKW